MSMKLGSQIPWFVGEIRDRGILGHFVEHICALLPVVEARPTPANISAVFRVTEFFYKVTSTVVVAHVGMLTMFIRSCIMTEKIRYIGFPFMLLDTNQLLGKWEENSQFSVYVYDLFAG